MFQYLILSFGYAHSSSTSVVIRLMVLVFQEAGGMTLRSTSQVLHQKHGTVVIFFSFTLRSIWCYFYVFHIISIFFFYVQCSLHMLDACSLFTLFSLKKTSTRLLKLHSSNDQKALQPEASGTMLCPLCQDLCYHSPSAQLYTSSVYHYTQFRLQMITIAFYSLSLTTIYRNDYKNKHYTNHKKLS